MTKLYGGFVRIGKIFFFIVFVYETCEIREVYRYVHEKLLLLYEVIYMWIKSHVR